MFTKKPPEFFKHEMDLYCWYKTRSPLWLERGIFARQHMFKNCKVLDLCCGDGSYSYLFFSNIAEQITAIDYDSRALKHARLNYQYPNICYYNINILADEIPGSGYHVIVWNAAIEHFSLNDIGIILEKLKKCSVPSVKLAGYTNKKTFHLAHPEHEHEFGSVDELKTFLPKWLSDIQIIETWYPDRENFYFSGRFKSE
ncbi:MAG: class I SAM-dependent methyltransferase [Nitrospiria bacterium]